MACLPNTTLAIKRVYFPLQLFDKLRKESPEQLKKVHGIHGDMLEPHMGMSPEDVQHLSEKISVVFHSAATVRFDEALK